MLLTSYAVGELTALNGVMGAKAKRREVDRAWESSLTERLARVSPPAVS
jgi:hypothetical protein